MKTIASTNSVEIACRTNFLETTLFVTGMRAVHLCKPCDAQCARKAHVHTHFRRSFRHARRRDAGRAPCAVFTLRAASHERAAIHRVVLHVFRREGRAMRTPPQENLAEPVQGDTRAELLVHGVSSLDPMLPMLGLRIRIRSSASTHRVCCTTDGLSLACQISRRPRPTTSCSSSRHQTRGRTRG